MKRIAIDVTKEEHELITEILPWGIRRTIFKYVIEDICEVMISPVGHEVIAQVIARNIKYTDLPNSILKGASGVDNK